MREVGTGIVENGVDNSEELSGGHLHRCPYPGDDTADYQHCKDRRSGLERDAH